MKEENRPNQKSITVALVVIIIVLVFMVGILIGEKRGKNTNLENPNKEVEKREEKEEKTENKKEEPEKKPEEKTKEEKYESIYLTSKQLDDVPRIPEYLCGGVMFPLNKKDIYLKDLSDNDKLNLLISGYDKDIKVEGNPDYKPLVLTDEDIEKYFADTSFLNDIKKNGLDSGKSGTKYEVAEPIFIEFKNNKLYLSKYPTGCEGPGNDGYQTMLVNAKKNSKELVMSYKVFYLKTLFDEKTDNFTNEIYISKNDSKPKYKDIDRDKFSKLDLSEFDSYDMYFDITNGNIRFVKMIYNGA